MVFLVLTFPIWDCIIFKKEVNKCWEWKPKGWSAIYQEPLLAKFSEWLRIQFSVGKEKKEVPVWMF
jgi:hypothetical protein